MTYLTAALIVIGAMAAAIAASWFGGRLTTIDTRRRHHELGGPVFSQVGTLIAVLLAFVFSAVWGDYRTADQAINGECGALHGAAMLASALPGKEGAPVVHAIADYTQDVVRSEWSTMSGRHRSSRAAAALQTVVDTAVRVNVTQGADAATKAEILSLLASAHADRETRLFQVTQAVPAVMWVILIGISALLVVSVALAGVEDPGRTLFAATFAGAIASVLVLVRMLDFPFEGALALPPADFIKLLDQATVLATATAGT